TVLELDCGLPFDLARADDFFSALPPRPAVCLIELREETAEPLLIRTQDLRRRLRRLLGLPDPASKRLNLREVARGVRYRLNGSRFEQIFTYYLHSKQLFPKRYQTMMRLRPPAVLKVSLRNAYPRCYVTRRIPEDQAGHPARGAHAGPVSSWHRARAKPRPRGRAHTMGLSPHAAPRKPSPNALWIFSRRAAARSRFAAIR